MPVVPIATSLQAMRARPFNPARFAMLQAALRRHCSFCYDMFMAGRVEATHFETGWCFQLCSRVLRDLMISVEQHPLGSFEELYNRLVHFLGQELEMTLHRRRKAAAGIEHLSFVFQVESPGFESNIDSIAEQFMLVVIRASCH